MASMGETANWVDRLLTLMKSNQARQSGQGLPPAPQQGPPPIPTYGDMDPQGNMGPAPMPAPVEGAPPQSRFDQTLSRAQNLNQYAQLAAATSDMMRGPKLSPVALPQPQAGPMISPTATSFMGNQGQPDIQQLIAMLSRR